MDAFATVVQGATDPRQVVLTWGKHKGKKLGEVPPDYLRWALANATIVSSPLRGQMEAVLGLEVGSTVPPPPEPAAERRIKELEALVRESRDELARVSGELMTLRRQRAEHVADPVLFRRLVKGWYRDMSRRFHPDLGGSVEQQQVLNACYGELIDRLEKEGSSCQASSNGKPSVPR